MHCPDMNVGVYEISPDSIVGSGFSRLQQSFYAASGREENDSDDIRSQAERTNKKKPPVAKQEASLFNLGT
jgi:hypothetical protein